MQSAESCLQIPTQHTSLISSSDNAPARSCLFAKTRREAPAHTPSRMSPGERGIDIWCDVLNCRCRTGEFLLNKKVLKLLSTVAKPSSVCAVYHPHHPVCGLEVVAPIAVRDECACQWRESTGHKMSGVAGGGREMAPFCAHGSRLPHNPTNKLRTCIQCTCLRSVFWPPTSQTFNLYLHAQSVSSTKLHTHTTCTSGRALSLSFCANAQRDATHAQCIRSFFTRGSPSS